MQRILSAIVALLLVASPALAGDYADREIIGFSPDGAYFAFEQYGVQDGSGFPYAAIFVIDTAADDWVEGSPFEIRLDDENAEVADAREAVRAMAQPMLTSLGIGEPGELLVSNPITEIVPDPHRQDFQLPPILPRHPAYTYSLRIEETVLPAPNCPGDFGYDYVGYALFLTAPGEAERTLHADTRIPGSRNCPIGYAVSDVLVHDGGEGLVLIVLLDLYQLGFEGPNRRFLAVATTVAADY